MAWNKGMRLPPGAVGLKLSELTFLPKVRISEAYESLPVGKSMKATKVTCLCAATQVEHGLRLDRPDHHQLARPAGEPPKIRLTPQWLGPGTPSWL